MLTAESSADFNPTITQLAWRSPYSANFTVSNVWLGNAGDFFQMPAAWGDFNEDGVVDAADYSVWRDGLGAAYSMEDYAVWKSHFGQSGAGSGAFSASTAVPEPTSLTLLLLSMLLVFRRFF
jgi:hypothetical protein